MTYEDYKAYFTLLEAACEEANDIWLVLQNLEFLSPEWLSWSHKQDIALARKRLILEQMAQYYDNERRVLGEEQTSYPPSKDY